MISTIIARCPTNFINLSAIIVELRLAEYDNKLRRNLKIAKHGVTPDVFKITPKKNTKNNAAKFCTACSNTLMHILWKFYQNLRWSSGKHLLNWHGITLLRTPHCLSFEQLPDAAALGQGVKRKCCTVIKQLRLRCTFVESVPSVLWPNDLMILSGGGIYVSIFY